MGKQLETTKRPYPQDTGIGCWDISRVREASSVRDEARRAGTKVHFGRIAELRMEKGRELPTGHELRKYKGRAVFLGDNVRDEHFTWAEFAELSSNPPSMEASRAVDAVGSLDGYLLKYGDAKGAHTQSYLPGVDIWVAILCQYQWRQWVLVLTTPMLWPSVLWQCHPSVHANEI